MSNGVEFDEDKFGLGGQMSAQQRFAAPASHSTQSKMAAWLVKKGIVKSETGAQVILLVIVLVNIVISILVIKYFI